MMRLAAALVLVALVAGPLASAAAPPSPINLRAASEVKRIELAWGPPTGGAHVDEYRVYRSASPGVATDGDPLLVVPATRTDATDVMAPVGERFWYVVTAVNAEGESAPSGEVSREAAPVPARVEGLAAEPEPGSLLLRWRIPVDRGVVGFQVWRDAGDGFVARDETGFINRFHDDDVADGRTYRYVVTAVDGSGASRSRDWADAMFEHEVTGDDALAVDLVLDRDGDGVRDRDDAYPLDATRSRRYEDLVPRYAGWAVAVALLATAAVVTLRRRDGAP